MLALAKYHDLNSACFCPKMNLRIDLGEDLCSAPFPAKAKEPVDKEFHP